MKQQTTTTKGEKVNKYLKPAEVKEIVGCHSQTLYNWRQKDMGPPFVRLPNGKYLYPKIEFENWINTNHS